MLNIILSICGVILIALTAVVVYSDRRSANNLWLGAFLLSGLAWLVANLLANLSGSAEVALIFAKGALVGSALIPATFLAFCYSFTHPDGHVSINKYIFIFGPIALLLTTTPTKFNVISAGANASDFKPGGAFVVLLLLFVIYFTIGTVLIVKDYHQATALRRQQLYYILLGTALSIIPGIVINALLPLYGYSKAASIGPAVVIFFSAFTAYAIVKHRLFDVRLLIARSLGYTASLIILATLYGAVVFGLSRWVFGLQFSTAEQIFLSVATGIASLTFQRFQKVFDNLSSRLFYRDAYDTQNFLDQFNKILVSSFEINPLLRKSVAIIDLNLKTSFSAFVIHETVTAPRRILGTDGRSVIADAEMSKIRTLTPHTGSKIIVTLELDDKHKVLKQVLRENNIDVVARLATTSREEGIGYLVLGPKKSGNPYSSQDVKVIEIIANELVIAIQNALHTEEIENFNLTLQAKVDEATRKMRRTNEKLKELDETKDDFISMASHQLRTPLTSVKGYISMVLEGDAGKLTAMQREMLGQAFFSSQRMVYLISDLLNVSRLKTGKFVIEASKVDLVEVVKQELHQLEEAAASRSLNLTFEAPNDFPSLMFDETKTRQVIMNFTDNAIYYTPAGGHIKVRLINNPTTVELRVEDDGIGVPKAEQHHLFTKFYRAGNARQARPDGTGLGLFMAKKVIAAQGGSVIFNSSEGKGSTFGFVFSKAKLLPPESSQSPAPAAMAESKSLTNV